MFRPTNMLPISINFLHWVIDPLITLVSYLLLLQYFKIELSGNYMMLAIVIFLLSSIIFRDADSITSWQKGGLRAQSINLLLSWGMFILIIYFFGSATGYILYFSKDFLLAWSLITPLIILIGHTVIRITLFRVLKVEKYRCNVVIVGASAAGKQLGNRLLTKDDLGLDLVGYIDDRTNERIGGLPSAMKLIGDISSLSNIVTKREIKIIYIALPVIGDERILNLLDKLQDTTASVYFVPDIFLADLIQARVDNIHGVPIVSLRETPFYGVDGLAKKLVDLVVGFPMLVVLGPIMLIIAILIKMSSKGPIIFKQRRYGLDGKEIQIYKFRTMKTQDDGEKIVQAKKDDDRITRIGKILRRTSLDELPQLVNVLQGKMSLVGPRPQIGRASCRERV